jgi:hypothetical protein
MRKERVQQRKGSRPVTHAIEQAQSQSTPIVASRDFSPTFHFHRRAAKDDSAGIKHPAAGLVRPLVCRFGPLVS